MHNHLSMMFVVAGACALAACDKNASKDESSTTGQPVYNTNASASGPTANRDPVAGIDNAASVTRFADEVSLAPKATKLVAAPTTARTTPLGGQAVAVLDRDTPLTEVAKERDYYLVVFPDPSGGNKKLAGWVYKDRIEESTATVVANAPHETCPTGEVYVLADGMCMTACTHDADCKAGGVCDGNSLVAFGEHPSHAQYCIGATGKR